LQAFHEGADAGASEGCVEKTRQGQRVKKFGGLALQFQASKQKAREVDGTGLTVPKAYKKNKKTKTATPSFMVKEIKPPISKPKHLLNARPERKEESIGDWDCSA
jgi:hypothetical protein